MYSPPTLNLSCNYHGLYIQLKESLMHSGVQTGQIDTKYAYGKIDLHLLNPPKNTILAIQLIENQDRAASPFIIVPALTYFL